jgi:Alpha/beta-hydrolase family
LDQTAGSPGAPDGAPHAAVISPTGTGYVNYVAVETAEYLTRGNMASVSMQYSLRPSPLSLDRVAEGRTHYRMLIDAIHNALAERPADKRPRVVLFGESLGAWTSQDAFAHRGTQGLLDARVDRAIWIGTPYMSRWKQEVLHGDRPDVDRSLVGRFNDFGELEALDPEARRRLRYVMITHANDTVGHFGLDLLVRAPAWLGPAETRAATVPGAQQWRSPTTFVQTLVDMKNAANVIPGQFEAKGHDYRADLARFVREVYALPASDDQLAAVERALRASELERKRLLDAAKAATEATARRRSGRRVGVELLERGVEVVADRQGDVGRGLHHPGDAADRGDRDHGAEDLFRGRAGVQGGAHGPLVGHRGRPQGQQGGQADQGLGLGGQAARLVVDARVEADGQQGLDERLVMQGQTAELLLLVRHRVTSPDQQAQLVSVADGPAA